MSPLVSIPDPPYNSNLLSYSKKLSFPAYRFVPGLYPHPTRDPKGHSYRQVPAQPHPFWTPDQWNRLEAYLCGVDLFNRFYFWEAHEAWEVLWTCHPTESDPARFVQGLINIAASFLKLHMEDATSAQKLWNAASALLVPFVGKEWMGIDVSRFLNEVDSFLLPIKNGTIPRLGPKTPVILLRQAETTS